MTSRRRGRAAAPSTPELPLPSAPPYFAERRERSGRIRFYWKASKALAKRLPAGAAEGAGPWRPYVRLPDERAAAEAACRQHTAAVLAWLEEQERRARGLVDELRRAGDRAAPALDAAAAETVPAGRAAAPRRDPAAALALRSVPGTLAWAIADYKRSGKWQKLAPSTQATYDWMFAKLEDWGGWKKLSAIEYADVAAVAARLAARPPSLRLFLILLGAVMDRVIKTSHGRLCSINPVSAVAEDYDLSPEANGYVWPRAAVPVFARAAELLGRPSIALAIVLNEWLAQRPVDLLAVPRAAYRDRTLHVVQRKTNTYVPLPLGHVPALSARLEAHWAWEREHLKVAALKPATLLLCESTGQAWHPATFRAEFARIRDALGGAGGPGAAADRETLAKGGLDPVPAWTLDAVPARFRDAASVNAGRDVTVATAALRFAHLRHTGITRLHQAGATDDQIRSISGHTNPAVVYKHYLAVTAEAAQRAFATRLDFEATEGGKG